ncbi:hypothetical protein EJ06DRAFT_527068 [Trichodelitschia bisporula]|uniref:Uncharacterized protein n=1 Tax=Trichodelitschia bisporula TaxID=703511 RepID=A0A6G1I5X2_9PEZI|nr:hypothetical protein EJ06DRAFT_527068 [Trichodelitschia bisporula]
MSSLDCPIYTFLAIAAMAYALIATTAPSTADSENAPSPETSMTTSMEPDDSSKSCVP